MRVCECRRSIEWSWSRFPTTREKAIKLNQLLNMHVLNNLQLNENIAGKCFIDCDKVLCVAE